MLDQSFNYANVRAIYNAEKRKGIDIDAKFFNQIRLMNRQIRTLQEQLERKEVDPNVYKEKLKERDSITQQELQDLCSRVNTKQYKMAIYKTTCPKGNTVFTLGKNKPEDFFYMKFIQSIIRKCYKVVQADRVAITKQVKIILGDSVPKTILRVDIQKFYDNIPHSKILDYINKDPILSPRIRKIIASVLSQYRVITGRDAGIPRGLGMSAYLSELYMRSFDNEIKFADDVIYYARYVDDIIIIFSGQVEKQKAQNLITSQLERLGLKIHKDGDKFVFMQRPNHNNSFSYLGYQFDFSSNKLVVDISLKRSERIKKRVTAAFLAYWKATDNGRKSETLLFRRIKFLTSNTKLYNTKKTTLVGIFFSNQLIDFPSQQLDNFDIHLESLLENTPSRLKERLRNYTFNNGFETRRFVKFTTHELDQITGVWKYEA